MSSGMCVGFKAGEPDGHHLINNSKEIAKFLAVGTRVSGYKAYYPGDDFQWMSKNGNFVATKKDGTPYE